MKKYIIAIFLLLLGFLPAEAKQKVVIATSPVPINTSSTDSFTCYFSTGQRIFYGVSAAKSFQDTALKIQIIKKENNAPNGVYTMAYAKTASISRGDKFYTDYVILTTPGYYVIRVFELRDLEKALVSYGIWVK